MAENNYLIEWKDQFSLPNYLTGNNFLSPDGSSVSGDEASLNLAQSILLNGSAVGTHDKHFLNPTPLFNKLGEIYTIIVNSAFTSARTDAIKMNRYNMDYTNGESTLKAENLPIHEFFRFFEDTNDFEINTKANAQRLAGMLATLEGKGTPEANNEIIKFSITNLNDYYYNIIQYWGNTWFNHYPEIEQFLIDTGLTGGGYITYIIEFGDGLEPEEYYVPSVCMSSLLAQYLAQYGTGAAGLQLLMPQYKRRVEVEDLNENFWVISQILDAVVNALWGPYGLIDVLRQLIFKITQIEEYLGLDQVEDIDIMMAGDDDMYFDMYSRFELSSLQLKLKTPTGERVLKDIFKNHNERSDRNSTTEAGTDLEVFYEQVQQEIMPDTNSSEDLKSTTGLYDSDIIRSEKTVNIDGKEVYLSLSTVIDALNDRIVAGNIDFTYYKYQQDNSTYAQILKLLDPTKDGTMSVADINERKKDVIVNGTVLSKQQIENLDLDNNKSIYDEIVELIKKDEALQAKIRSYYKTLYPKITTSNNIEEIIDWCFNYITVRTFDEDVENSVAEDPNFITKFKKMYTNKVDSIERLAKRTSGESDFEPISSSSEKVGESIAAEIIQLIQLESFLVPKKTLQKVTREIRVPLVGNNDGYTTTITFYEDKDINLNNFNFETTGFEYTLNVRAAAFIAKLLADAGKDEELLDKVLNFFETNYNIAYKTFSLANADNELNVRDASAIARSIATGVINNPSFYQSCQDFGRHYSIKDDTFEYNDGETKIKGSSSFYGMVSSKTLTFNEVANSYTAQIYTPTDFFFKFLISNFKSEDGNNVVEIIPTLDKQIENSITSTEYGLWDNLLIFLYDGNYYEYQRNYEGKVEGLYVKGADSFYNVNKPLILSTSEYTDTYLLFVPRKDLYQGEIIQLRLTPKGKTKRYLDFSKIDTTSEKGAFSMVTSGSKLFLSLHNCFSVKPTYNNTRTTLFFKDTTPEVVDKDNIKSISDWFCNGIQCFYFKPVVKIEKGTKSFVPKSKKFDLKIYASMIAKRDDYIDNSFYTENITTIENPNYEDLEGAPEYCPTTLNIFERSQKYCAAIRNNLIFYSTPGLNENNQYIHSPLQLLMSARNRGDSDSIQTTRTYGEAAGDGNNNFTIVPFPAGKGTKDLTLDEIKDILYSNAYGRHNPLTIQAFFGTRKVDEYIKWKQVKYIVFEKESGNRNELFGPTHATITAYDGYLHWDEKLSVSKIEGRALKTYHSPIKWIYTTRDDKGNETYHVTTSETNEESLGFPPKNVKYGYIELPNDFFSKTYSSAFSIQIFSCGKPMTTIGSHQLPGENLTDKYFHRRPIFKTAYFFGINEDGKGNAKHAPYKE